MFWLCTELFKKHELSKFCMASTPHTLLGLQWGSSFTPVLTLSSQTSRSSMRLCPGSSWDQANLVSFSTLFSIMEICGWVFLHASILCRERRNIFLFAFNPILCGVIRSTTWCWQSDCCYSLVGTAGFGLYCMIHTVLSFDILCWEPVFLYHSRFTPPRLKNIAQRHVHPTLTFTHSRQQPG